MPMMPLSDEPKNSPSQPAASPKQYTEAERAELVRALKSIQENKELRERVKKTDPNMYFCYCIGWAITKWAAIDQDIFHLFCFALNIKNAVKAARLYYRVQNISDRFQMVDALMELDLNKKQLLAWTAIRKEFNRLSAFRNRLAHDPINAVITLGERDEGVTREYQELNIANTKLLRTLQKPKPPPVRLSDIEQHSRDLVDFQFIKLIKFFQLFPKQVQKRLLRPPSIPPRLKALRNPAKVKKHDRKTARHKPRPPTSRA